METKTINKKIKFLCKNFKDNNYILSEKDIADLIIQLNRKPIQLYLKTIDVIKLNNKQSLTYENVSQMIKDDIKIRNQIRNLTTSLEEAIRVEYIDQNLKLDDVDKFLKISQDKSNVYYFYNIINNLNKNEKDLYEIIKNIRNKVSHLTYPMIFDYFKDLLIELENIKKLDFVNNKTVDSYIKKINEIKAKWLK